MGGVFDGQETSVTGTWDSRREDMDAVVTEVVKGGRHQVEWRDEKHSKVFPLFAQPSQR